MKTYRLSIAIFAVAFAFGFSKISLAEAGYPDSYNPQPASTFVIAKAPPP